MWFKQLSVFHLPSEFELSAAELEAALQTRPLEPCGAFDMVRTGWVAAGPGSTDTSADLPLVHSVHGQHLLALGSEEKLLPAAIVRQETADRARLREAEHGEPLTRKQLRALRDEVADELRARAFSRRRRTYGWFDPQRRRLVLDNTTPARNEQFLTALRDALATFAAPAWATKQQPRNAMTDWLQRGQAPKGFTIDDELELRALADTQHCVRYVKHPLDDDEIRDHLRAGLAPTRLGLTWRDRVSFQLADTLHLRRLQFVGLGEDTSDDVPAEERFDSDFALLTGELSKLIDELTTALGGVAE